MCSYYPASLVFTNLTFLASMFCIGTAGVLIFSFSCFTSIKLLVSGQARRIDTSLCILRMNSGVYSMVIIYKWDILL